jgi:hypothetical protein
MDRYLESQRATLFRPDEKAAEFNRENTIIASACYSAVYNRMSNGLATPIEMAWWGEPWLNSLKAREWLIDSAGLLGNPTHQCSQKGSMNLLDRSGHQSVCPDPPTGETSRWNFASKKYDIRLHRRASLLQPHRSRSIPESFGRTSRLREALPFELLYSLPLLDTAASLEQPLYPISTRQDIYVPVSGKIVSMREGKRLRQ